MTLPSKLSLHYAPKLPKYHGTPQVAMHNTWKQNIALNTCQAGGRLEIALRYQLMERKHIKTKPRPSFPEHQQRRTESQSYSSRTFLYYLTLNIEMFRKTAIYIGLMAMALAPASMALPEPECIVSGR